MNPGQQVTPTLRLARMLGQGGMGSVWVADHLALGTQVAVKFMSPSFAQHTGFVERFRREAMSAAQIKHPHVAQVFDHGVTDEGLPYIVMELLEGEDLKSRIRRLGPLPTAEVARIVSQAAKALGKSHQLGIVHRDIKPDNLFLLDMDGEPFVKVLDFGVAKQSFEGNLSMTSTGSMLGTPLYMSPEQLLSSKHVDFRSDLWALGVVAYHALTGQVPFSGETLGSLSVAVHAGVFAAPSTLRPGIQPPVDAWVQRALQRDPTARFGSAKEMADALEQAVGVGRGSMASGTDFSAAAAAVAAQMGSGAYPAQSASGERLSQSNPSNPMSGPAPGTPWAGTPSGQTPSGQTPSGQTPSGQTPSGALLAGSGAGGPTFAATATSGTRAGRGRASTWVAIVGLAVLMAGGAGLFLGLRGGSGEAPTQATDLVSPTAAARAPPDPEAPAPDATAEAPSTATPDAPAPEVAPAAPAPLPAETSAPASSTAKPGTVAGSPLGGAAPAGTGARTPAAPAPGPAAAAATTKPASTAKPRATTKPMGTQDTIGF